MKKILSTGFLMLTAWNSFALEVESKSFIDDPLNHPFTPVYALFALLFVVILLVCVVGVVLIKVLNTLTERASKERAAQLGIAYKPRPSFWQQFAQTANASVPLEDEKSIELDHDYDGIKELDNHLPPWWKWLFYGTIGWAAVYMVVFHFSQSLPLMEEEYDIEIAQAEKEKAALLASKPRVEIDENKLEYRAEGSILTSGKSIYDINCKSCHRADGGGGIGPNLTDEYWLHGGDVRKVFSTVKNGVTEKGMPSWSAVLSPEQLRDVSFYIMSLGGTAPAGAKAPQGELFQKADTASDSLKVQASL